jgi:hypothetical protein
MDKIAPTKDPSDSSKDTKMELQSPAMPADLRGTLRRTAAELLSVETVASEVTLPPSAECQKTKKWIL